MSIEIPSEPLPPPPAGLPELLKLVIVRLGPCSLRELLKSTLAAQPGLEPGTVHDALNGLIASGDLKLSPSGCYYKA